MLNSDNTTIVCIDIQDKLVNMLSNGSQIKDNAVKLMKAAAILDINTIVTEQYPKGLGNTISEIKSVKDFKVIEKTSFSAIHADGFPEIKTQNVIIFGIETHICVYQTALELSESGKHVYIISDCSSSRSEINHKTALDALKQQGIIIETLEMVLFQFLGNSRHQNFKEIQGLII